MKEGQTQTFVSAWPGLKDRRAPKWLAAFSSYYAGVLAAITIALLLRISLLMRAMPLAIYLVLVGAGFTSWCCSLLTGASGDHGMVTLMLRYYQDLWLNKNLFFTYLSGVGPAIATQLIVYSIWNIGLAYTTVFVVCGNAAASLCIDHFGIGWNHPKRIRPAHIQASVLLVLGSAFLQFDIFPEQVIDDRQMVMAGLAALFGAAMFSLTCASLAELAPLFSSRSRALTVTFARATLYLPVFMFLLVPKEVRSPVVPLDCWELWALLPVASVGMALTFLASHVAASEGATAFNIEFWTAFSIVAAATITLDLSSLPARSLDISHIVGFAFVMSALLLNKNVSKRQVRQQLAAIPNRRHGDEQCQICIKNDLEITRLQRELQDQPNIYDPGIVIAAAGSNSLVPGSGQGPLLPVTDLPGEPKSGPIRGL